MRRAYNLLRPQPWYRREAFSRGLRVAGYEVIEDRVEPARPGDVLLIWNRYGGRHEQALAFEHAGGTTLVAENGYIGAGGSEPKFDVHPGGPQPHHYYALAKHYHHGRGEWFSGGPERFSALGLELKPWRTEGDHILICPNRSFGVPPQVMPKDWAERTAARVRQQTERPVRIRRHPGNDAPARRIGEDLRNAWAVVVWSSNVGVQALVAGIPVICMAPFWICKNATQPYLSTVEDRPNEALRQIEDGIRFDSMTRLAWAQWRLDEIEQGTPFDHLLSTTRESALA